MAAKRRWSSEQLDQLKSLFHTDLPNKVVAKIMECGYTSSVKPYWLSWFGDEAVHGRFRRLCSISKTGSKNPMVGMFGNKHPRYKEPYIGHQGYRYVDVPEWYTGPTKAGKYFEHILVGCEKYGLTEMPEGHVFQHKDEDKLNNNPDNVELMTSSQHMLHHAEERRLLKV